MKPIAVIAVCTFFCSQAYSQTGSDTAYLLEEQVVRVPRAKDYNAGNPVKALHTTGYKTLGDMLSGSGAAFVKQYGQGLLATSSVRGLSASQVAVLWNGFSIQSPLNGVYDFNLIPSFFIDNAGIEYGGSSAIYGNGALAGAISMGNAGIKPGYLSVYGEAGSFGLNTQALKMSYGNNRLSAQTRLFRTEANNNFIYQDYFQLNSPGKRQEHAHYRQNGVMQELSLRTGSNSNLNARFWYNMADRELPPAIGTSAQAQERQYDDAYRATISYSYAGKRWTLNNRNAWFREAINYYNANLPNSYSIAYTLISETDASYKVNAGNNVLAGFNETWTTGKSDGYPNWPQQYMSSLYGAWKYSVRKLSATLNIREVLVNGKAKPLTGAAGFDWQVLPGLLWQTNIASSCRMPTFNDLYWASGGNRGLKPERGMKQETGLKYSRKNLKAEAHVFRNAVDNWIIWLPSGGSNIWSPQNIRYVLSRGAQATLKYKYTRTAFKYFAELNYQYVRSENRKAEAGNEEIINRQLIYVPVHTAAVTLSAMHRSWYFRLTQTYTGKRFTSTDNRQFLQAFTLMDMYVSHNRIIHGAGTELALRINNLLNTPYEVVERKPMPGINFLLSLRVSLNYQQDKPIKKSQ